MKHKQIFVDKENSQSAEEFKVYFDLLTKEFTDARFVWTGNNAEISQALIETIIFYCKLNQNHLHPVCSCVSWEFPNTPLKDDNLINVLGSLFELLLNEAYSTFQRNSRHIHNLRSHNILRLNRSNTFYDAQESSSTMRLDSLGMVFREIITKTWFNAKVFNESMGGQVATMLRAILEYMTDLLGAGKMKDMVDMVDTELGSVCLAALLLKEKLNIISRWFEGQEYKVQQLTSLEGPL